MLGCLPRQVVSTLPWLQALMRLPSTYTWQDCREMTRGCCELLQLEHVMNSVVGSVEQRGISGGQRKRVNIGLELVCPSGIFTSFSLSI